MKNSNDVPFDMSIRRTMPKQQYRTSMGILSEILQIIMDGGLEGVMISEISRKANLSHNGTADNCQKLLNAYLIESIRKGRNYIFVITPKGIEFFKEFKIFQDMAQEMNLRC